MDSLRALDFCIIGAQKAGTTALVRYLMQHPDIFIPLKKELHLFNRALIMPWSNRRASDQEISTYFEAARPEQICGEATPAYFYWPDTPKLLADHNPNMKILVCLRHPVIRAVSAWRMEVARGRETLSFSEAIRTGRARVREAEGGVHKTFSYVERGFYSEQIKTLFQSFNRSSVLFIRSENIVADSPFLQRTLSFLGVDPIEFEPERQHVFGSRDEERPDVSSADLSYLQSLYRDDMQQLSGLTGLDFQDWIEKQPRISDLDWSYASAH